MDSTASPGDFHVIETGSSQFLFVGAGATENRVCVRIDEPGHEDTTLAVDGSEVRITRLERLTRTHVRDAATADRYATSGEHAGVAHFFTPTRAWRASARNHLRRIDEQQWGQTRLILALPSHRLPLRRLRINRV
jgi:hypothetical protein